MELNPIHPAFGAEVLGVDLRRLSDTELEAIRQAQQRHGVLVFRQHGLSDEELGRYAAQFGPLQGLTLGGGPADQHVFSLSNMDAQGNLLPPSDRTLRISDANRLWHTDNT